MNAVRDLNTERKLFELREKLISRFMSQTKQPALYLPIQVVASDALEQAVASPLPLIVYPVLFDAKSEAVLNSFRDKTNAHKAELSLAS